MAKIKKAFKSIGRQIWSLFKGSFSGSIMYACAGSILVMLTFRGETSTLNWSGGKVAWTVVCIAVASMYTGFMSYMHGTVGYDMLVAGNMKRTSAFDNEEGIKMSKHVVEREYRVWKGFGMGAFMMILPIIGGLVFGAKQESIDKMLAELIETGESDIGMNLLTICVLLLSGWSILPFFISNATIVSNGGVGISYYYSCLFALIPFVITGVMYILGAYGKRAKTLRQQQIADREAETVANMEKKVNYGGLPGTKPKKRK